jgi:UDP-2-acetamido-3-amino-2,3-dideoxy-glucuronate N-acetyltransferase
MYTLLQGQNMTAIRAEFRSRSDIGCFNIFGPNAVIDEGVVIGSYNFIDCHIGKNTKIQNHVELRAGTVVGVNCYIDSGVKCSGDCIIEDDVTLRYDAIIARGCLIGEQSYICPQVMFNNLNHNEEAVGGAHVGAACFIGTNATIGAGLKIADTVIIGAKSLVTKSCTEAGRIYMGIPARLVENK